MWRVSYLRNFPERSRTVGQTWTVMTHPSSARLLYPCINSFKEDGISRKSRASLRDRVWSVSASPRAARLRATPCWGLPTRQSNRDHRTMENPAFLVGWKHRHVWMCVCPRLENACSCCAEKPPGLSSPETRWFCVRVLRAAARSRPAASATTASGPGNCNARSEKKRERERKEHPTVGGS